MYKYIKIKNDNKFVFLKIDEKNISIALKRNIKNNQIFIFELIDSDLITKLYYSFIIKNNEIVETNKNIYNADKNDLEFFLLDNNDKDDISPYTIEFVEKYIVIKIYDSKIINRLFNIKYCNVYYFINENNNISFEKYLETNISNIDIQDNYFN